MGRCHYMQEWWSLYLFFMSVQPLLLYTINKQQLTSPLLSRSVNSTFPSWYPDGLLSDWSVTSPIAYLSSFLLPFQLTISSVLYSHDPYNIYSLWLIDCSPDQVTCSVSVIIIYLFCFCFFILFNFHHPWYTDYLLLNQGQDKDNGYRLSLYCCG